MPGDDDDDEHAAPHVQHARPPGFQVNHTPKGSLVVTSHTGGKIATHHITRFDKITHRITRVTR